MNITRFENCPDTFQSPTTDADAGKLYFVEPSNGAAGNYTATPFQVPGQNITTYIEGGVGLLGGFRTFTQFGPVSIPSALSFLKGEIFLQRGRSQQFCFRKPFVAQPMQFEKVASQKDLDKKVVDGWAKDNFFGGYVFNTIDAAAKKLNVSVYVNATLTRLFDVPGFRNLIVSAFSKSIGGIQIQYLGSKNVPTDEQQIDFDLISLVGPLLYVYVFQLVYPVLASAIVYEKEHGLREIMKMMGLNMNVYWIVTYIYSYTLYLVALIIMWVVASLLGFRYYTQNDAGVIFMFIFLWGHVLVAQAFVTSTMFGKSRTVTIVGYLYVFASGLLAQQLIRDYFTNPDTPETSIFFITCVPTFAMFRGLLILSDNVSFDQPGLRWADINLPDVRMGEVYVFFIVQWIVLMLLTFYLEAVLPSAMGVKREPLFFIRKDFWSKKDQDEVDRLRNYTIMEKVDSEPEDVAEQRSFIHNNPKKINQYGLVCQDLRKVYPGDNGVPDKVAVQNLCLRVPPQHCFGFLGPNGAGKSTTISMLSGMFGPTGGTAKVFGLDLRTDMELIHQNMGVCPQDNILWDDLTGEEHLLFYGRLKNLSGDELSKEVQHCLGQVNLADQSTLKKFSSQYSGGMKRRLSVACSLVGSPSIVLLDEPTTGLDPASRRQLWDVIKDYKRKACVLLTTHAMEEADALCDTLGIFAEGEMKTLGSAANLKERYGRGLKVTISAKPGREQEITDFMSTITKEGSNLLNSLNGTQNFDVDSGSIPLSELFNQLESSKEQFEISDWGVSNTTLEEVFLRITEGIESEF
eukprot:TRINITY_DN672_c0_g1_i2.p1 TRINITY_DN672_c0_g1~~TRINITY_DN672_c0_g1_i2.p1  ORF type:complete len:927 (-),score=322.82 TRINITY_DN672_c0_g1_i2:32-2431(-)